MALSSSGLAALAAEIVKAGLASESIKLQGSHRENSIASAKASAEMDVAYLDTLIKGLIATLAAPQT